MRPVSRLDRTDLGNSHLKVGKHFKQKRLKLFIAAIDLVDQQHWRAFAVIDRLKQRSLKQKRFTEQIAASFSASDADDASSSFRCNNCLG